MSFQLPMVKKAEALQLVMQKHDVNTVFPSQVHVAMDVSGSFDDEHRNGYTQELLNRLIPFAMLFDKDKTVQSVAFASSAESLDDIDSSNYQDYVKSQIMRSRVYNGGTNFAAAFEVLLESTTKLEPTASRKEIRQVERPSTSFLGRMFGRTETVGEEFETEAGFTLVSDGEKHIVFFVTDGETWREDDALREAEKLISTNPNLFIVFISIYNSKIGFLDRNFSNRANTDYLNFTVDQLRNLSGMSDEDMYNWLLTDSFKAWMNK